MSNTKNLANLAAALDDGTSGQVLQSTGSGGVSFVAAGSSVTAVQDLTALGDISSPSAGDMALVTDLNKIFVRKTAGWFLIATVTNQGPQSVSIALSGGGSGTSSAYELASDGSTTSSVTGSADPDPEADDLTWSAAAGTSTAFSATLTDGGGSVNITTSANTSTVLSTISQSSNVFTLTPSSSTTAPNGGTFAVTFSVTDGVNTSVDNTTTFTLAFGWTSASQQAKIQASDAEASDRFGYKVHISSDGNTAIVGAYQEDAGGSNAGAAYVFTRSGSNWSQQQKLTASDAAASDQFGASVALSEDGNTAIVGANGNGGSAYVFTRSGSSWSQQQIITGNDTGSSDQYGGSVSLSSDGNTAIVGARSNSSYGAAYVWTRSGSSWSQQQKLTASDQELGGSFGSAVALSDDGNTAIIGAGRYDTTATDAGAAYVFTRSGSSWSQQTKLLASDGQANDEYGENVAISSDGNTAIVGAMYEDTGGDNSGAVYVYTRSGSSWSQQQIIKPDNPAAGENFGSGVSLSDDGNTAVIGAQKRQGWGAAYVFARSGSTWSQKNFLTASDKQSGDDFGRDVAISDDAETIIVGAWKEDTTATDAGSAYIFVKG